MEERLDYQQRIDELRATKMEQTMIKHKLFGTDGELDTDDKGMVPPPADFHWEPKPNHSNGGWYGAKSVGENYRDMLEKHPIYIDPMSSLAGGFMVLVLKQHRRIGGKKNTGEWNPDFDFSHLHKEQKLYNLVHGIGASQHFNADVRIGLKLGWKGILDKITYYRAENGNDQEKLEFYNALEDVVLGMQNWIGRHANAARDMAALETRPDVKKNLEKVAEINRKLVNDPPETFWEACQWLGWYYMSAVMYNGSGAAGAIDDFLKPYYDRDKAAGILNDEEAMFHIACLLLKDNQYYEIGGTYADGSDRSNEVSFLTLEAAHRLKIPTCICLRVHENLNPQLLEKAVEYLFEDKTGAPSFLGSRAMDEGFVRNGYPIELARQREKTGCHWCALPGREYTMNDVVKINFAAVFEVALKDMMGDPEITPCMSELWKYFEKHLRRAVGVIAEGMDFHLKHMYKVFPELVLDLLCYGTIEKGLDATHGGVEFYNLCIDGAGLGTVADSFGALEQRVEKEGRLTWEEMMHYLDTDYEGAENIRMMMKSTPRYGSGNSPADGYAVKVVEIFSKLVKEKPTPEGYNMIPGLFSWANTIPMGKAVGATPNGRHACAPITHGANPEPGFAGSNALTAMATAVASVQCGYGNAVPIQLEIDPVLGKNDGGFEKIVSFIRTYCTDMGGTLMNINILNKDKILEAHADPYKYPDLVVRVTGFSAYFASLSKEFRQLVVDRIIQG